MPTPLVFGLALAAAVGGVVLANLLEVSLSVAIRIMAVGSGALALATGVALFRGLRGIALAIRGLVAPAHGGLGASDLLALLGNLLIAALGAFLTLLGTFGFSRGRQLRRFGRVLLPGLFLVGFFFAQPDFSEPTSRNSSTSSCSRRTSARTATPSARWPRCSWC